MAACAGRSLDIVTLPIGPDIAEQIGLPADYGILIERVLPGGAAEKAGLHGGNQRVYQGNTPVMLGGDLIVGFDGQRHPDAAGPECRAQHPSRRRYRHRNRLPRPATHDLQSHPRRRQGRHPATQRVSFPEK